MGVAVQFYFFWGHHDNVHSFVTAEEIQVDFLCEPALAISQEANPTRISVGLTTGSPMRSSHISRLDIGTGVRLLWRLPSFLRDPITLQEARTTLRRRLDNRGADFLRLVRLAIFQNPASPYRQLLDLAGCEYEDLEKLVREDGVEGALRSLFRNGVYLTVEEFKGRKPVVRGASTIFLNPTLLRNPHPGSHVSGWSSGSRGRESVVTMDLEHIRENAVNMYLELYARGGTNWVHASWAVPGGFTLVRHLMFSGFGIPMTRWFSQIEQNGLDPRYRWSDRALRWASVLAGVRYPPFTHVPLNNPLPIAQWMAEVLATGQTPHLLTFTSSAVRLCQTALKTRLNLRGAKFTLVGEPCTKSRLAVIHQVGAEARPTYSSVESGRLGCGCAKPYEPDDLHFFSDLHALIQPDKESAVHKLPGDALLISSLRNTAPIIMLNVSMGDQAMVVYRHCGCILEELGWDVHLETIRSFEKLTTEGMTFLDTDLIRVLEEVLPSRFGGAPTDYQLVEEENKNGNPSLRLFVHPSIGALDERALCETFLNEISTGPGAERVMGLVWKDARILKVERRPPLSTASGKILHLHVKRVNRVISP